MPSSSKSAVSEYEHLKYRFSDENQHQSSASDDDFLPLKSQCKNIDAQQESLDSVEKVPIPSTWSPRMIFKPNPNLFITPEKSTKGGETEDILEPRDLNKVPAPFNWSPHEIRPVVVVTPEKYSSGETSSVKGISALHKPAIQLGDTMKTKEKLSVRFDIPSNSSGDECMDDTVISDPMSPITIKGKDIDESHRSVSHSKVYNPTIYSDDSVLDDSIPGGREIDSDAVSLSTSANLVEKLNQLLGSTKSHTIQKHSMPPDYGSIEDPSNNLAHSATSKAPASQCSFKNGTTSSSSHIRKSSSLVTTRNCSKKLSHSLCIKQALSKPHESKSSASLYYPPMSGACVVRESKHPMVSTDYSYPFQNSDENPGHEHIFSRPEYNSTLKVRSELDDLCDRDVDVEKAVEIKLSNSGTKRTEIHEKAAVFTNHLSDQFTNLVDLEPAVDHLCDRVVRMRTCKATSQKKGFKQHKRSPDHKEPDLMEFYHTDLQKEIPDLSLLGISPAAPDLLSTPQSQAFQCYRHNRVWNGLRDFF